MKLYPISYSTAASITHLDKPSKTNLVIMRRLATCIPQNKILWDEMVNFITVSQRFRIQ
jgi:hypothetical protein